MSVLVGLAAWRHGNGSVRARLQWIVRPVLTFGVVAALVGSPWLIRNLIVAGDPVFPYHIGPFFGAGPEWDAARTAFMQGHGWGWMALWRAPLLPIETVLLGQQGSFEFDATLGPALLLRVPLGVLTVRRSAGSALVSAHPDGAAALERGGLLWPTGFAVLMWLIWAEELARSQVAMQSRLYLTIYVALALPAALVWLRLEAVRLPSISLARLTTAAILLCLGLTLLSQAVQTLQVDNVVELLGGQDRTAYETQQLGAYAAAMRQVDALGPHAHVWFLWEPRSYLTHAQVHPDIFLDALDTLYRRCHDAAGMTRCLREQGYDYVLYYQQGRRAIAAEPHDKNVAAAYRALDQALAMWQPMYRDDVALVGLGPQGTGWYVLYSLRSAP
jgi:hypothetical protein